MFDEKKRRKEISKVISEHVYAFGIVVHELFCIEIVDKLISQEQSIIEPLINCLALYYEYCKNDHKINNINETAKKLLEE